MIYVLREDEADIRQQVNNNPNMPVEGVQPLVIRANVGDCIEVFFENKLDFPASIHIQGVQHDVLTSDGAVAGKNPSSVAQPGEVIHYRWFADREGIFIFSDLGNPISDETGSNVQGLFGALIVEAPGSTWTDPVTGSEIKSGLFADIHHPTLPDFREYCLFFHDEMEIEKHKNNMQMDEVESHLINYRSEPSRIRHGGVECQGEECMMSSWVHGDPSTPVLHAYVGDPAKIRLIHGGVKETHVFHLHLHQWRLDPGNPNSTIIDSISLGPQAVYSIEPLFGAGSLQGSFGDAIFHCHLYPHFDHGMWGLWRIHDVLEDGSRFYPNGTPIKALQPLPDRISPPLPTPEKPGYPLFIPGTFGEKAPRPPLGIVGGRTPTPLEIANFGPNPVPGAAFVNPCPSDAPVREIHIVGIQQEIVYNNAGWHDPEGRFFVLPEDEAAVKAGEKPIEPLVIRANAGDCIDIHFTNKFPETLGGNAFQSLHATKKASIHVHLVKFDVLCSDGGANGWNYDSSIGINETIRYRWYADTELHTCFFHDHMNATLHQQHGVFAALLVEPMGSTYHHPETGEEIKSGTKAVIKNPNQANFREFFLAVHDFALLFDAAGNPLNPPPFPDSDEDPGVMGINYRNEPFQFRPGDPAYVFSSFVHGDPVTPLFEAYAGDPVRIRLIDGAHEEQHAFNLHRYRWRKEITDYKSPLVANQTLGISEAFNIEFVADAIGDQDILYYFGGLDDFWLGLWGIFRVYGERMPHLLPLNDRPVPPPRIYPFPVPSGSPPPKALHPGYPCPPCTTSRRYNLVAMTHPIIYNDFGDNDPNGLLFVLEEDEAATLSGEKPLEPLIIRANHGECVEIHLTNNLPEVLPETKFPGVPVDVPWPASNRVSLHVQRLIYDVRDSDGATVGFNLDQTIGPGESIIYRWFADKELGANLLFSFGDVRNHRHRGLFGVLIIEPMGSTYHNPFTGKILNSGAQAVISCPSPFREYVVIGQNGISLFAADGELIPGPPGIKERDFEDQGFKGFNYRSERFENRLEENPDRWLVFNSVEHGEPATPLFRAYVGDPVVFRYLMPADKPRNTSFNIHGHSWQSQPDDPLSNIYSTQGAISIGNSLNITPIGHAGGIKKVHGDFLYRSGNIRWDIEQGMWGIFRVHNQQQKDLLPLDKFVCPIQKVVCCVGRLLLVKLVANVQLMVPAFGLTPMAQDFVNHKCPSVIPGKDLTPPSLENLPGEIVCIQTDKVYSEYKNIQVNEDEFLIVADAANPIIGIECLGVELVKGPDCRAFKKERVRINFVYRVTFKLIFRNCQNRIEHREVNEVKYFNIPRAGEPKLNIECSIPVLECLECFIR
jgi:FtsP/CotA-like multicopper oxidase with cupredoxin domain